MQVQRATTVTPSELRAEDQVAPCIAERGDPVRHLAPTVTDGRPHIAAHGEVDAVPSSLEFFDDLAAGLS